MLIVIVILELYHDDTLAAWPAVTSANVRWNQHLLVVSNTVFPRYPFARFWSLSAPLNKVKDKSPLQTEGAFGWKDVLKAIQGLRQEEKLSEGTKVVKRCCEALVTSSIHKCVFYCATLVGL